MRTRRRFHAFVVVMTLLPSGALAQAPGDVLPPATSLAQLASTLAVGDVVRLTQTSGEKVVGRLTLLSSNTVTLTVGNRPRSVTESIVQKIERRRRESRWNGALIGAAIGAVAGAVRVRQLCGSSGDCGEGPILNPGLMLLGFAGGLGVGALVDGAVRGFETVFVRPLGRIPRGVNRRPGATER
jgi:hypothetical protein